MFKDIKLDDRSYQEIRDDAISKIVNHCPEWTNHNASDPGVTLVELFAYMSEMTQFRLNQVPQKNYLAFLDLLGIEQRLPIASSSRVAFELSAGYEMDKEAKSTVLIPAKTTVLTQEDEQHEALVFETQDDAYLSNIKLLNVYSKSYELSRSKSHIYDYTQNISDKIPFYPFAQSGKSDNKVELIFFSDAFYVLANEVSMSVLFRLPTTMREFDLDENFLSKMLWEYYDGSNWQVLNIEHNLGVVIDDTDADVLSVTFEGNCTGLEKSFLSEFSKNEEYYIKATFEEVPEYLNELSIYEVSVITNSDAEGVLPDNCFHNFENLDLNSGFYPFGARPTLEDEMMEENFYLQCDQAFCEPGAQVEISFEHAKTAAYQMPVAQDNLQIVYEYAVEEGKWKALDVIDTTASFTQEGTLSFKIEKDFQRIVLNAQEGYWIRAKILAGNYGQEEISTYDTQTGEVKITPATLTPPIFSKVSLKYSQERVDLDNCVSFSNYQYQSIRFDKNRPVYFFKQDNEAEDALYLAFDSYLCEEELELYFDIEKSDKQLQSQRVLQWEILSEGQWKRLDVDDQTQGLSLSADVKIKLPEISALETYSLYIDAFERMWIRISVKFNSLHEFPMINQILLNTVKIAQTQTYYDEFMGHSDGLPNMKYTLEYKNLTQAPVICVDEEVYTPVERFIDYGREDKVFRFNGMSAEVEFGDGEYGFVPPLGAEIIATEYSTSSGKAGNISSDKITVLGEAINYIDSVSNISAAINGQNGDTIEDLKRFAPSVLKSMQRAVTFDDYEHLARAFSPSIQKAKALMQDDELIVLVMTNSILKEKGFINQHFLSELQEYLQKLSMVTLLPRVQRVQLSKISLKMKLKYLNEDEVMPRSKLESELFHKAQSYFDPLTGMGGSGYEIGRPLLKSDVIKVLNSIGGSYLIAELSFIKDGVRLDTNSVELRFNEVIDLHDLIIEELSYDF